MNRKKIAIVVSSPMTVMAFWRKHIEYLCKDYQISILANMPDEKSREMLSCLSGVRTISIPIERKVSPWRDFLAFLALVRCFRREKFTAVHSVSPKAGLLAMSAAFFGRVRHRFHTFTGQVWATRRGLSRTVLKNCDRLIYFFSTFSLVDSPTQRDFLLREQVVRAGKSAVLASGSISGVDLNRFHPDSASREEVRAANEYDSGDTVLIYIGRLNRDKGLLELVRAFAEAAGTLPELRLLCVGPDEENMTGSLRQEAGVHAGKMRFLPFTDAPEKVLRAGDIFCLPSHREGFGSVIIEAAATGIPSIGSDIYGIQDAIADGVTGLLHPPGDVRRLAECILRLGSRKDLREEFGRQAETRARSLFSAECLSAALRDFYQQRV